MFRCSGFMQVKVDEPNISAVLCHVVVLLM